MSICQEKQFKYHWSDFTAWSRFLLSHLVRICFHKAFTFCSWYIMSSVSRNMSRENCRWTSWRTKDTHTRRSWLPSSQLAHTHASWNRLQVICSDVLDLRSLWRCTLGCLILRASQFHSVMWISFGHGFLYSTKSFFVAWTTHNLCVGLALLDVM